MKKFTIITFFLVASIFSYHLLFPLISIHAYKNEFIQLSNKCEHSKNDIALLDHIGKKEAIETRVNLFMNAKANEFSCFDLALLENKLLSRQVSKKQIDYLRLQSVRKDPSLIDRMDIDNK